MSEIPQNCFDSTIVQNIRHSFFTKLSILTVCKISLGRLYTFHISHFTGISRMFLRNTPQNTKHSLYSFRISYKFRVLLMPRKNKPQNPLNFCANADCGAKCKK